MMKLNKDSLMPYLIYNRPIEYSECITLYPVMMRDVLLFQSLYQSITVRKDSLFHEKKIIKMTYLEFLIYSMNHRELGEQYHIPELSNYFLYALELLQLCCRSREIKISPEDGSLRIDGGLITPAVFDDLRRIIILQNGIDFDMDEFINSDTEQKLLQAEKAGNKDEYRACMEDYIDSLVIAMNATEEQIMKMTVRKFWRYIRRYQFREGYTIAKTGESSGMVKLKEPLKYWMLSLEENDRYEQYTADENELKGKIG